jgi:cytochrome c oxidase accessory protein FixG
MTPQPEPVAAPERVLSTLNADGSRRWIRPRLSPGRFHARRRAVAWALIALFVALPLVRIGGRPAFLLDLPRREFTLFGTTFLPTETVLFMLLFIGSLVGIFWVTAMWGRIWCGWGCPQTVYLEFVFRPIERWLEGGRIGSMAMDRAGGLRPRRLLKFAIYLAIAFGLAHVFLAYFVPVAELSTWMRRSPVEHPTSFFIMALTTGLIFFDFAWFREQTCIVACPYGRLQSVLLDRRSLVVGYDPGRGEPRMRGKKGRPAHAGHCIDCQLCVITCPTGIDIRDGLQMECVHCTQCMDACDSVMDKMGTPRGLIRYTSQAALAGLPGSWRRPRVLIYPAVLVVVLGLLAGLIATRAETEITVLGPGGAPYTVERDGRIANQVRLRIANRGREPRRYHIELEGAPDASLIAPINPFPVAAGKTGTASVFVVTPPGAIAGGSRPVSLRVRDGGRFDRAYAHRLHGPQGPGGTP